MNEYAVIFDMDGVLVDSYAPHFESWVSTCNKRGFTITDEIISELFGRAFKDFADRISPTPLTPEEICEWHDEKEAAYREIIKKDFPEIDGAFDLITALHHAGFTIGIASSGSRDNVECILEKIPSPDFITAVVSACDTTHTKPHPEPFLKCAEKLNIEPSNCAVIEDSIYGLQAARAGGMKAIGLTGTRTAEELAPYADLVVDSLRLLNADSVINLIKGMPNNVYGA